MKLIITRRDWRNAEIFGSLDSTTWEIFKLRPHGLTEQALENLRHSLQWSGIAVYRPNRDESVWIERDYF